MNLKPTQDYVLLQVLKAEQTTTESGIFIPESARNTDVKRGLVLNAGPGLRNKEGQCVPVDVSVGDIVMYIDNDKDGKVEAIDGELKINRFEEDGNEYVLIREFFLMTILGSLDTE